MKLFTFIFFFFVSLSIYSQNGFETNSQKTQEQINKEIAKNFYEDLWFNNRTENYSKYVADEYTVHDIGDRKKAIEPAIEQKQIADRFWNEGTLSGEIDYQIAEGDLVATRWHADLKGDSFMGKIYQMDNLPIINVFRIKDGKIVEIWNHRHDIETNQTLRFTFQGLMIGLLIALIPLFFAISYKRRLNRLKTAPILGKNV